MNDNNPQEDKHWQWKKGQSGNPNGRPKGAKGKITQRMREAMEELQERQFENVENWLTQVAAEDPAKALDLFLKMNEYVMPKLARQENVHELEEGIEKIKVEIKRK